MPYKLNPFTGELDLTGTSSGGTGIAQIDSDAGSALPIGGAVSVIGDTFQGVHTSAAFDTVIVSVYDSSEVQKGVSELATSAETISGTESTKTIVPTGLKAKLGNQTSNAIPFGSGDSNALSWSNALENGEILIGSTLGTPQAGHITSTGGTVTITEGSNTINLEVDTFFPPVLTLHGVLLGNGANDIQATAEPSNGQLLIGSTGNFPVLASLTAGSNISITPGAGSISIANTYSYSPDFASVAETKAGTSTTKIVNPADVSGYMDDMSFSGIQSWTGAGAYFDDTTLGTFSLLRGGTGYIKGKLISFAGGQSVTGMTAGNCYFIYIDSAGVLQKSSTFVETLYTDNIVLFECLRDSTAVTNNQVTVREDHPHNFPATASVYLHNSIGPIIQNTANGANITLNGTQKIAISGADVLLDHGLNTIIPDSGGAAVTFYKYFTLASGKWARYTSTDTFTGHYNNAGTVTALTAGRFAVYTLYCSKDSLNSSTPFYYAVLDTSQYSSLTSANNAIANGTVAQSSNELSSLEVCRLGYIVYRESTSSIVQVTISKSTFRATFSTNGTNTANLINTSTTDFNGWLTSANTNVQSALDELDDSRRAVEVTGATQACAVNRSYTANRATAITFTLPAASRVGDEIEITGLGNGGWIIAQNANQYINNVSVTTTIGVGGSLSSTQKFESVRLKCTVADLGWNVVGGAGNWTVV